MSLFLNAYHGMLQWTQKTEGEPVKKMGIYVAGSPISPREFFDSFLIVELDFLCRRRNRRR